MSPVKFKIIKSKNKVVRILIKPPIFKPRDRKIWDEIVPFRRLIIILWREVVTQ